MDHRHGLSDPPGLSPVGSNSMLTETHFPGQGSGPHFTERSVEAQGGGPHGSAPGLGDPPYSCLTPTFSRICPEKSQPAPGLGTAPSLSCRQAGDKGERPASPGPQHLPSVFPGNALLLPSGPSPRSSPAPASSSLSSRQGEGKQTRAPHPPAGGAGLGAPLWGCPRPANGHEAASDKRSERWPEAPTPE